MYRIYKQGSITAQQGAQLPAEQLPAEICLKYIATTRQLKIIQ